jgi:hypothetical protein
MRINPRYILACRYALSLESWEYDEPHQAQCGGSRQVRNPGFDTLKKAANALPDLLTALPK